MTVRKILHICKMTGVAGTENHLLTLLPGLSARGFEVHLLILTEPGCPMDEYAARMTALGVPTEQTLIRRDVDFGLITRIRKIIQQGQYDTVHTHLIHADLHGIIGARRAGIKTILTTGHNDDPFRRRLPIRLLQRYIWRRVARGIAISEAIREYMITVEGAPPDRAMTIHYGLDLRKQERGGGARDVIRAELGLPPQSPILGSVCRLIEQKGLSDGLRAFWQLSRKSSDAHYVIVGDGPLRDQLRQEAEGYGLAHRVHFLGWRDDAAQLMTAFDALIMPSRWEGFGLVVLEAMAAKLPIVATRVSALPEIVVDGETGFLVTPGDIQALSQAMLDICEYPAQAREMGIAGRARLETEFSAEKMIERTAALYAAL
jgi:glycosyltransferase involved in cell wall biosynthesis